MIWVCQDQKPTLLLGCPVAHIVSETKDQLPAEADHVMAFQPLSSPLLQWGSMLVWEN